MKNIIYIFAFLNLTGCNNVQKTNSAKTNLDSSTISKPVNKDNIKPVRYSDRQLESYLDSIGQLQTQPLADNVAFEADSIFKNQLQPDTLISLKDFNILKRAARKGGRYEKSKITKAQILSYYLGNNDFLFINSYYKILKTSLPDTTKRRWTLNYLNEKKITMVKNEEQIP